jgi:hypothetical protein
MLIGGYDDLHLRCSDRQRTAHVYPSIQILYHKPTLLLLLCLIPNEKKNRFHKQSTSMFLRFWFWCKICCISRMKKFLAIFCILLIAIPFAATYTYLSMQKKSIKKGIKSRIISGIDENELCLLGFLKSETDEKLRFEHEKEFEYLGEMYDIVDVKCSGDSIYYLCWWDHEETKLNKKLKKLLERHMDTKNRNDKRHIGFSMFCKGLYNNAIASPLPFLPHPLQMYYHPKEAKLFSLKISPPSPPPKSTNTI